MCDVPHSKSTELHTQHKSDTAVRKEAPILNHVKILCTQFKTHCGLQICTNIMHMQYYTFSLPPTPSQAYRYVQTLHLPPFPLSPLSLPSSLPSPSHQHIAPSQMPAGLCTREHQATETRGEEEGE